jgi:xylan 1,4-beta-xylosidase
MRTEEMSANSDDDGSIMLSSAAAGLDAILQSGVSGVPDIGGLATRSDREVAVMVWNYHDDALPAPPSPVRLSIAGLPAADTVLVEHYRIDDDHSNAYTAWQQMRSPQKPTAEKYDRPDNCSSCIRPSGCR